MFRMFRICSQFSVNVQNVQIFQTLFSQCSESVQNFQSMFRMFRICSECLESVVKKFWINQFLCYRFWTFWTWTENSEQILNILNRFWTFWTLTENSEQILNIDMFRMFRICSDNVQNVQNLLTIFSQCSECSDFSDSVQSMFRICSEFSVNVNLNRVWTFVLNKSCDISLINYFFLQITTNILFHISINLSFSLFQFFFLNRHQVMAKCSYCLWQGLLKRILKCEYLHVMYRINMLHYISIS
jgi:hypothetical protein